MGSVNPVVLGVLGHVLLQFAIGAWVSRSIFTERGYINAGRQLGLGIAAFSVFATWFGAEAIVGTAGTVYREGSSARPSTRSAMPLRC